MLETLGFGKDASDDNNDQAAADMVANSYQSSTWEQDFTNVFSDYLLQIYVSSIEDALGQTGLSTEGSKEFHQYAEEYANQRTAELVKNLDDSTRNMLKSDLLKLMKEGKSPYEIATELEKDYAFSESRAFTIGRTETGFAYNHGIITTYQNSGAKAVTVFDGDHDPECQQADGETWSFDYAMVHRLEHPNCVRSFGPQMEDVTVDRS